MADKQTGPTVYTALIMPLSSHATFPKPQPPQQPGQPRPPSGGQPPRPDHTLPGDLPRPEHPIFLPLPPGLLPPQIDNSLPPWQPPAAGSSPSPPRPDQGLPPVTGSPPKPDQGLPGSQPHPEHPIVLPPDNGGWAPIFIWGPNDPRPTPPIEIPPDGTTEDGAEIKFKAIWTPDNGWQTIGVIVPGEEGKPHPSPSAKK
jgi:hypothetical protein